jgi:hypothetical protein
MIWPPKPTVHYKENSVFKLDAMEPTWRPPRDDEESGQQATYRTCYYCGSIHPEDLVSAVTAGAKLGGADWKHGWPHKFYVEGLPNLRAGQLVKQYVYTGGEKIHEPKYDHPASATLMAKWYNEHIMDAGYDGEALHKLLEVLELYGGIQFNIDPVKGLGYRAPHRGYQR